MEATPVFEKRQLRQRKPPPSSSPSTEQLESDEEVRGRSKRRKTALRSDVAAQGADIGSQPSKEGKGKTRSGKKKPKAFAAPKLIGKKTRSVVKGDTGGAEMEEEEEENDDALVKEEEEEEDMPQEPTTDQLTKRVLKQRTSQVSEVLLDAQLVGDPIDDAVAKKKWPHRYATKGTGPISPGQSSPESPGDIHARRHYNSAKVDGIMFELYDDAYVKVPDYAISHLKGKSVKCFGRLWWDETVPTVVTRAEPHNQTILHPVQERVLTIRENARLQGFPDYYKFSGPLKQRYMQVGNAVAVPVGRALGYGLGRALQKITSDGPLFTLPSNFLIVGHTGQTNSPGEVEQ